MSPVVKTSLRYKILGTGTCVNGIRFLPAEWGGNKCPGIQTKLTAKYYPYILSNLCSRPRCTFEPRSVVTRKKQILNTDKAENRHFLSLILKAKLLSCVFSTWPQSGGKFFRGESDTFYSTICLFETCATKFSIHDFDGSLEELLTDKVIKKAE